MKDLLEEYIKVVLSEKSGEGGAEYESIIFNAIKSAGASGKMKQTAGFASNLPDADITINGVIYNVEVKMDGNAQMGGGSVGWKDGEFFAAGRDINAMIPIADSLNGSPDVQDLNEAIENLCKFLSKKSHKQITGFPMGGFLKTAWEEAVLKRLLVPINVKLESSVDFISHHYRKKGTYYIQIGGQGLFHLGENPAGIPGLPKLKGNVVLEVRAGRSGGKGQVTASAGLRVQPRLKIAASSDYTLDTVEGVKKVIAASKISQKVTRRNSKI